MDEEFLTILLHILSKPMRGLPESITALDIHAAKVDIVNLWAKERMVKLAEK